MLILILPYALAANPWKCQEPSTPAESKIFFDELLDPLSVSSSINIEPKLEFNTKPFGLIIFFIFMAHRTRLVLQDIVRHRALYEIQSELSHPMDCFGWFSSRIKGAATREQCMLEPAFITTGTAGILKK